MALACLLMAGPVWAQYTITTVAGNGNINYSGDNVPATQTGVNPTALALDTFGNLYLADGAGGRSGGTIRKINTAGIITTVAGGGLMALQNGLFATTVQETSLDGVAADNMGNFFYAEGGGHNVVRVNSAGLATSLTNQTSSPANLAADSAGNIYVADHDFSRIVKLDPSGNVSVVVGSGSCGYSGDNGPPASAQLCFPTGVAVDSAGNLYIADTNNSRVRRISSGVITTVAGNGTCSAFEDGIQATTAGVCGPASVAVDNAGNLYIAVPGNGRVLKVDTSGILTTIAGGGTNGVAEGSPATTASLNFPKGLAVDSRGRVYVAEGTHVRLLTPTGVMPVPAGALAHVAAGGGWVTVISLINTSTAPVNVTVQLRGDDGSALSLPVTVTQASGAQTTTASSFNGSINPNGTLLLSTGDGIPSTAVGWANVLSTGSISGFAIFRFIGPSGVSEGTVPLQSTQASYSKITVPFDNTANFQTGVALANLSSSPVTVTATVWDQSGSPIDMQSFTLLANGHTAFNVATQWTSTDNKQGIIVLQSNGGGLTGLGLRFSPFGTFTSVPSILSN
jgi:sugar lactone lactonase YvrE